MKNWMLGVCAVALTAVLPSAYGNNLSGSEVERELKDLRSDKLALAVEAGTLGAMARVHHLTSWESHAQALSNMRQLVNRSGARIEKLEKNGQLTMAQRDAVKAMRVHLEPVAAQTEALIGKINESRFFVRRPAFYREAQQLVAAAERSASNADRAVELALNGGTAAASGD